MMDSPVNRIDGKFTSTGVLPVPHAITERIYRISDFPFASDCLAAVRGREYSSQAWDQAGRIGSSRSCVSAAAKANL